MMNMYIDDFDLGQIEDYGNGYYDELKDSEEFADTLVKPKNSNSRLSAEDYMDLFLENFN